MRFTLYLSLVLLISGCAAHSPSPTYAWGSYEQSIYNQYHKPDKTSPSKQIAILTREIEKAQDTAKQLAPGLYAHLGYLHTLEGNVSKAKWCFENEKRLFPESTALMDRLIDQTNKADEKRQ